MQKRFKEHEARGVEVGPNSTIADFHQAVTRINDSIPLLMATSADCALKKTVNFWGNKNEHLFEGYESPPITSESGSSFNGTVFIGISQKNPAEMFVSYRIINGWDNKIREHMGYKFLADSIVTFDYETNKPGFVYQNFHGLEQVKFVEQLLEDFKSALQGPAH